MANKFLSNINLTAGLEANGDSGTLDQILTSTATGIAWVDPSTISSEAAKLVVIECKNTSGATITKGTPVYQTGTVGATDVIEIAPADALISAGKQPAIGLLQTTLNNNGFGKVVITGEFLNFTTDPIDGVTPTTGDKVFLKSGGGLTLTKPTGAENGIQNLGLIGKVSGGNAGSITVSSIMRTNDVPNLPTGKIWVGDGNTIVSDTVFLDEPNGRMGIGTTSPGHKLQVDGGVYATNYLSVSGVNTNFNLYNNGTTYLNGNTTVDSTFLVTNGNVGIGTTSPNGRLDIAYTGTGGTGTFGIGEGLNISSLTPNITFNDNSTSVDNYAIHLNQSVFTLGRYTSSTSQSPDLVLKSGNVGIGTTSPSVKLDVNGGGRFNTNTGATPFYITRSGANDQALKIYVDDEAAVFESIQDETANGYGSFQFRLDAGVTEPYFDINKNNTNLFRVNGDGNVGIGTTSPTSKLTISSGVSGDGSWNDSGILIENTSTTTGEPTLAFRNAGTNGTGSSYWFTGLNQSNLYKIAFGTSFTDGNTKLELSTTGGLRLNSYTQGFLQTDANGNVSTSGGGVLPGGPYLPLVAGSGFPLTGDLYVNAKITFDGDTENQIYRSTTSLIKGTTTDTTIVKGRTVDIYAFDDVNIRAGSSDNISFTAGGVANAMYINSAGNVGIGTTNPGKKLHVVGDAKISPGGTGQTLLLGRSNGQPSMKADTDNGGHMIIDSTSNFMSLNHYVSQNVILAAGGGNVGIGTTSPSQKLEVIGRTKITQSGDALRINSSDANGPYVTWQNNGSNIGYIGAGYHLWSSPNNIATSLGIRAQTRLDLGIQSSVHMTMLDSGNVGIGTTSPTTPLHVDGIAQIVTGSDNAFYGGNYVRVFGNQNFGFRNTGGLIIANISMSGNSYFNGGNVGIGTTAPSQKLHVAGNMRLQNQFYDSTNSTGSNGQVLTKTSGGTIWADNKGLTPITPGGITATIVGETIEIAFNQSTTSNIDYYQVWSSDDGGDYGIIGQIAPADFSATMTVVDTTFVTGGTMSYRVYAVKAGVYSPAGTVSKAYTVSALDVTNMTVVNLNTAYYVQYEKPVSRFIDHIEIWMDSQTTQAALNRSNATLVYSGQNASYMRSVGTSSNFHQFWVEVVTS